MIIASLISAFSGFFTKIITQEISSLEAVFFRNIIGLLIVLYSLHKFKVSSLGGAPLLLFTRGFLGFVGILFFFYAIANIPLGLAITLNKTSPIFGAIFSWIFLKEYLRSYQIIALFIAFLGVIFILKPFDLNIDLDMFMALTSGLVAGLAYTSVRGLKKIYNTREILFSFSLIGSFFPFVLLVISHFIDISKGYEFMFAKFILPDGELWVYIFLLGLSGILSQYFMTKSYESIKTAMAGAIAYMNIPFAIFLGILLGDARPSTLTIVGIGLVIMGGVFINIKFSKKIKKE